MENYSKYNSCIGGILICVILWWLHQKIKWIVAL